MTQRDYAKEIFNLDKAGLNEDDLFKGLVEINKRLIIDEDLSLESKCALIKLIGSTFDQ